MESSSSLLKNPSEGFPFEGEDWIGTYGLRLALERGYGFSRSDGWRTRSESLNDLAPHIIRNDDNWYYHGILIREDVVCSITLNTRARRAGMTVYGKDEAAIQALLADLRKALPQSEEHPNRNNVPVTFWTRSPNGPKSIQRDIDVPTWEDIRTNYSTGCRKELDYLHGDFIPAFGGQLLLWHGVPGTGKTYAIRSLAQKWQDWAEVEYIVDPDAFFGDSAYMMGVLLDRYVPRIDLDELDDDMQDRLGVDDDEDPEDNRNRKWRLFILEDCGELLMQDAKDRVGQGLSRLLNLVDGLIGQGLRILLLITTNEELGRMHPAVTRPGRAAMNIGFSTLNAEEVEAWAAQHDIQAKGIQTLAQLFSVAEQFHKPERDTTNRVGFQPKPTRKVNGHSGHTPWEQIRRG